MQLKGPHARMHGSSRSAAGQRVAPRRAFEIGALVRLSKSEPLGPGNNSPSLAPRKSPPPAMPDRGGAETRGHPLCNTLWRGFSPEHPRLGPAMGTGSQPPNAPALLPRLAALIAGVPTRVPDGRARVVRSAFSLNGDAPSAGRPPRWTANLPPPPSARVSPCDANRRHVPPQPDYSACSPAAALPLVYRCLRARLPLPSL